MHILLVVKANPVSSVAIGLFLFGIYRLLADWRRQWALERLRKRVPNLTLTPKKKKHRKMIKFYPFVVSILSFGVQLIALICRFIASTIKRYIAYATAAPKAPRKVHFPQHSDGSVKVTEYYIDGQVKSSQTPTSTTTTTTSTIQRKQTPRKPQSSSDKSVSFSLPSSTKTTVSTSPNEDTARDARLLQYDSPPSQQPPLSTMNTTPAQYHTASIRTPIQTPTQQPSTNHAGATPYARTHTPGHKQILVKAFGTPLSQQLKRRREAQLAPSNTKMPRRMAIVSINKRALPSPVDPETRKARQTQVWESLTAKRQKKEPKNENTTTNESTTSQYGGSLNETKDTAPPGSFQFGASNDKTELSTPATGETKPAFQFGASGAPSTGESKTGFQFGSTTENSDDPSASAFQFGATSENKDTNAPAATDDTKDQGEAKPAFQFGSGNATQNTESTAEDTESKQAFQFGASNTTQPSSTNAESNSSFQFGASNVSRSSSTETEAKPAFQFGASNTTQPPSSSAESKPAFGFGASSNAQPTLSVGTDAKPSFQFGSSNSTPAPATNAVTKAPFQFGASGNAPPESSNGTAANSQPAFQFGEAPSSQSAGNSFGATPSFGQSTANAHTPSTSQPSFQFGAANQSQHAAPSFGAPAVSFGSSNPFAGAPNGGAPNFGAPAAGGAPRTTVRRRAPRRVVGRRA